MQVPSLVSKYIKGLVGGVEETPVCLFVSMRYERMDVCIVALTARGNRNVVLLFSQGVSLPSLLTCTCFRITMPVSTLAKNKQTPCSIFKSPAPQNRKKNQKKNVATAYASDLASCKSGKKNPEIYIVTYIL